MAVARARGGSRHSGHIQTAFPLPGRRFTRSLSGKHRCEFVLLSAAPSLHPVPDRFVSGKVGRLDRKRRRPLPDTPEFIQHPTKFGGRWMAEAQVANGTPRGKQGLHLRRVARALERRAQPRQLQVTQCQRKGSVVRHLYSHGNLGMCARLFPPQRGSQGLERAPIPSLHRRRLAVRDKWHHVNPLRYKPTPGSGQRGLWRECRQ